MLQSLQISEGKSNASQVVYARFRSLFVCKSNFPSISILEQPETIQDKSVGAISNPGRNWEPRQGTGRMLMLWQLTITKVAVIILKLSQDVAVNTESQLFSSQLSSGPIATGKKTRHFSEMHESRSSHDSRGSRKVRYPRFMRTRMSRKARFLRFMRLESLEKFDTFDSLRPEGLEKFDSFNSS